VLHGTQLSGWVCCVKPEDAEMRDKNDGDEPHTVVAEAKSTTQTSVKRVS